MKKLFNFKKNFLLLFLTSILLTSASATVNSVIVLRSQYEQIGDSIYKINDPSIGIKPCGITGGNGNGYYKIDSNTGKITVNKIISDVSGTVHTDNLVVKINGNEYDLQIVNGYDYFISVHPGYTLMETNGDNYTSGNSYTINNNIWGPGSAVNGKDFRMGILYKSTEPDATIFIWDTPSTPAPFGGGIVWSFQNIFFGNKLNIRTDVTGFPLRVSDIKTFTINFDFQKLYGSQDYKVAYNQYFMNAKTIDDGKLRDGDLFIVFDQAGNFIPKNYNVNLGDTIMAGYNFAMLYTTGTYPPSTPNGKLGIGGYETRRLIIKDGKVCSNGTINMRNIYNHYINNGCLNAAQYIANVAVGLEIGYSFGAVRFNTWNINITTNSGAILKSKANFNMISDSTIVSTNPVNNSINIKVNPNINNTIEIVNVLGKVIYFNSNVRVNLTINANDLGGKGIYIIRTNNKSTKIMI